MESLFLQLLQLAAFWLLVVMALIAEYLDWFGRLEVLEVKHPTAHKFVNARPFRLVLLLLITGMLAENTREVVKQIEGDQELTVAKLPVPAAPEVCKTQIEFRETRDSLRRKTMRLADDFYSFVRDRQEHHPPSAYPDSRDPNPSDERKKAIALCLKYDQETQDRYNRLYRDRFIGIIREYQSKGVPVGWLEASAKNGNIAWVPPGSSWEGTPSDQLTEFRNLAYRVDAQDNLIVLTY